MHLSLVLDKQRKFSYCSQRERIMGERMAYVKLSHGEAEKSWVVVGSGVQATCQGM